MHRLIAWRSENFPILKKNARNSQACTRLSGKRTQFLSDDDTGAIQKMLQARYSNNRVIQKGKLLQTAEKLQSNLPTTANSNIVNPSSISSQVTTNAQDSSKPLLAPNSNWRQALVSPYRPKRAPSPSRTTSSPSKYAMQSRLDILNQEDDLTYEDFEAAMRAEEEERRQGSGYGNYPAKFSTPRHLAAQRTSLEPGQLVPAHIFSTLTYPNATPYALAHSNTAQQHDVVMVYVDPNAYTETFKLALAELQRIPMRTLSVGLVVVSGESSGELKRKMKKASSALPFAVVSDASLACSRVFGCVTDQQLPRSCLAMLEASTGMAIKVWYEKEYDVFMLSDLVREEVLQYRRDPKGYLQFQMGL
eukprot:gene35701-43298_t